MTHQVEWETDQPELTEDQRKKIAGELAYLTEQVDEPGDLIFHHIWLTEDMDGPTVMVYGKPEQPATFFMSYYKETKWVPLEEDSDEVEN